MHPKLYRQGSEACPGEAESPRNSAVTYNTNSARVFVFTANIGPCYRRNKKKVSSSRS